MLRTTMPHSTLRSAVRSERVSRDSGSESSPQRIDAHTLPSPVSRSSHAWPPTDTVQSAFLRCPASQRIRRGYCSRLRSFADGEGKSGEVYQGMFGPWSVEPEDELEVALYRSGIAISASALLLGSLGALLPDGLGVAELLRQGNDVYTAAAALGLGTSLYYIHIYVTALKRFVQALWAAGVLGAIAIAATQGGPVAQHVALNPSDVWLVGPFFAAITGVAFKEGMCYGKPEAAGLFFVTPLLLLGHLTGWLPGSAQQVFLGVFTVLVVVFAARKFTQPVKDDIGDKSVFIFQALPEDQQEAKLAAMRQSKIQYDDE